MSKTYHHTGQKHHHAGRDLWSKRPLAGHGAFTAENKKLSRRIERKWFARDDYKVIQYHLSDCIDGYISHYVNDMYDYIEPYVLDDDCHCLDGPCGYFDECPFNFCQPMTA